MKDCICYKCSLNSFVRSLNIMCLLNLFMYLLNFARFFRFIVAIATWWYLNLWNIMYYVNYCYRCDYWRKNMFFHYCFLKWSWCRANYTFVFFYDVVIIFILLKYCNSWFFARAIKLSSFYFLIYKHCIAVCVISEMCSS